MRLLHRYVAPLPIAFVSVLTFGCSELSKVAGPSSGGVQITATTLATAGQDRDPDGFTVAIDNGIAARMPVTGLFVGNLPLGTHSVMLGGIAPNCSARTNPQVIELTADQPSGSVGFQVDCQPNVGSLRVSTVLSGQELPEGGISVVVPQNQRIVVPINGSVTISDLRAGVFNVGLDGVAPNCDHLGSPVRPTEIMFGKTAEVAFTLLCSAAGRLEITTRTSGPDPDQNGYTMRVSNRLKGTSSSVQLPANGITEVAGLPVGDYALSFSDIVNNCAANVADPASVVIAAGSATSVAIDVACEAAMQIAYETTTGLGAAIMSIRSNGTENFALTSQLGANVDPAWSPDGNRLAISSFRDGHTDIYVIDADAAHAVRLTETGSNFRPDWSPDGSKIAFVSERDGNAEIYVMDADGNNQVRLTNNSVRDDAPSWSADGSRIAFQSDRDGFQGIWIMNADGNGVTRLSGTLNGDQQPAWSPDGNKIAFSRRLADGLRDIFMIDVDGSHLTQLSFNYSDAADPSWSRDGRQIAFSALYCDGYDFYYSTCSQQIILARTDGRVLPSTPVLVGGYNPAWRQ